MTAAQTARACGSIFRIRFAETIQYRAAAISGVMISVFWALIECVVYSVFYTYGENSFNTAGMSLSMTITYIWLNQSVWMIAYQDVDGDIRSMIANGNVGLELCRPLDLYWHWFTKGIASEKKLGSWMRALFTLIAGLLMPAVFRIGAPASLAGFFLFLLSLFISLFLSMSVCMLATAMQMNITWGNGPVYIFSLLGMVLSGGYLPLRLWPEFLQGFLRIQPFAGLMDTPLSLYIGTLKPEDALFSIGMQLIWIVVFITAGRLLMSRRLKTISVQGG